MAIYYKLENGHLEVFDLVDASLANWPSPMKSKAALGGKKCIWRNVMSC